MASKEKELREIFFKSTKHWHFEELRRTVKIGKPQLARWLKIFEKEGIVKRVKPQGKMPYYRAHFENPHYFNTKKIFGLTKFHEVGLLDYLSSLEKAQTIILFGSFSRGDWYEESDIDLFIYGDIEDVDLLKFQSSLHHEFQIFHGNSKEDLEKFGPALLKNILKGITLKGNIPTEVYKHAAI